MAEQEAEATVEGDVGDVEDRARRMGWVPEEEYTGPRKALTAEEFVKRAEDNPAIGASVVRRLEQKLAGLERQLVTQAEFHTKQQIKAYERGLREAREQAEAAVEAGDTVAFKAAQKREDDIRKDMADATPPAQSQPADVDPALQDWLEQNKWFHAPEIGQRGDRRMTAYALEAAQEAKDDGLRGAALYARIGKEVREAFPAKFEGRKAIPTVEGGGALTTRAAKGGRTYNDLPAEARRMCDETVARLKKRNPDYSREQWLAHYEWD